MTEKELNKKYIQWMYCLVYDEKYTGGLSYKKLFNCLHSIDFQWTIPIDGNRAEDGISLRYHFGYLHYIDDPVIASGLDNRPCSVLEMMVALANRCEEDIMEDIDYGDRRGQWFWEMVESLGLINMNDSNFDPDYTEEIIFRFMNHEYSRNGRGGLFTIDDCERDVRNMEIWAQMNWHLSKLF